jgi:hypothetical protein
LPRTRFSILYTRQPAQACTGGINITEGPFIRRDLAVGVHVPLAQEQGELVFGKVRVDEGQGDAVERQVPGGVPWVGVESR